MTAFLQSGASAT